MATAPTATTGDDKRPTMNPGEWLETFISLARMHDGTQRSAALSAPRSRTRSLTYEATAPVPKHLQYQHRVLV